MRKKRATSFEVAKRAGVSRTTVSFVLNNVSGANISEAARQRVLDAARELGYVPDAAARTLASGQTRTLGLLLYDAQHLRVDAFLSNVLYSLIQVSREQGFRAIVETVEDVGSEDSYEHLVRAKQIDGLVVLNPRSDDKQLTTLIDESFPIVLIGNIRHPAAHAVFHRSAADQVMAHLIGLGHERIAHITYAPPHYRSAQGRLNAYRRALEGAGFASDDRYVRYGNYSAESGYMAMNALLEQSVRSTAVFAGNDTIAVGALAAINAASLRVPGDIAIVGYDDIPIAAYTTPPLTTVRTPALEQGRIAAEMLIGLVRGEAVPERKVALTSEFVIRRSCGSGAHEAALVPS